ncbi:peptidylprolyl isomerase [Tepidiforma sp.]|uniref:peptidylprolyl isomerase n=1 Tax=Tepidiforma sp. TaxID=2682230 RepID=UPI002ADDCCCA|nr:peptidylprolyl isomerase [Tepidiforma sp.]
MPKRKRRELHHMRQEPSRRRTYQLSHASPSEIYKPGFPMNVLGDVRWFAAIGVVVAVAMVVTAVLTTGGTNQGNPDALPTVTPTASATADASPTTSPTATAKQFEKAEQVIDAQKNNYSATFKTSMGDFTVRLFADVAPNTVNSFVFLAKQGFYDNITFHRIVSNFVIQGGDPTGTGTGGPGYQTQDEPNQLRNKKGTIAMAKVSGQTQFGSQFFINLKDNPSLDFDNPSANKFYPFGEVVSGMEVVEAIGKVQVGQGDRPVQPVTIKTIEITETPK